MKVYIEAYYHDGTQKLGNLDGQGIINAKQYKRTKHYKALSTFKTLNGCVCFYRVVNVSGIILETVKNYDCKLCS